MTMTPRLRKLLLTAHVAASVGWLGAVVGFLALAAAGLTGRDALRVRAAYLAMESVGWSVVVPFSLAALLTGLVQSIVTEWGLFRHRWVAAKVVLTIASVALLPLHLQPVSRVAAAAAEAALSGDDYRPLRVRMVVDAALAVGVLLAATGLSVYKPWGRTRWGRAASHPARHDPSGPSWWVYALVAAVAAALLFAATLHLAGGNHGH